MIYGIIILFFTSCLRVVIADCLNIKHKWLSKDIMVYSLTGPKLNVNIIILLFDPVSSDLKLKRMKVFLLRCLIVIC